VNPLNECAACGEDFTSLRLFDAHILSKASDPHFDCMQTDEMVAQGWQRDIRGRWLDPASAERARAAFATAA
jgi:hypothetical protein